MRGYTDTGVIGRPSLASADKGRAILESLARSFKDHLALLSEDAEA
jgi:creatinine amidohydrolase